jgi:tetratricopeptide (TPR) repeat protein
MNIRFYSLILLLLFVRYGWAVEAQTPPASKKPAATRTPAISQAEFEKLKEEAQSLFQSDKMPEALSRFNQLAKMRPACTECWWYLGTLNYDQEKFADAAAAFSKFVVLEPMHGQAWGFLGLSEYKLRRYGLALTHLDKARNLGLGDNEELKNAVRFHHAVLLNQTGNFEAARFLLIRTYAAQDKGSPAVFLALGMADLHIATPIPDLPSEQREMALQFGEAVFLGYSGKVAAAVDLFEKLEVQYQGQPNVAYAYGVALSEGQRHEEALKYFHKELERDPNHVSALLQIAWILVMKAQYADAKSYVRKGLAQEPENFAGVYLNGRILLAEHKIPEAIFSLEKAVKLDPESANAYFSLMQAYRRANRTVDAEKAQKNFERLNAQQMRQSPSDQLIRQDASTDSRQSEK